MLLKMLVFFVVATWMAWILLFVGLRTRHELKRRKEQEYTRASGIIVDYRMTTHGRITTMNPVVEFTADGEKLRLVYENGMDQGRYPKGAEVDVRYDVSAPSCFHLEDDPVFVNPGRGAIRVAVIWIGLGLILTVCLAVFVGGATFDFGYAWRRISRAMRHR